MTQITLVVDFFEKLQIGGKFFRIVCKDAVPVWIEQVIINKFESEQGEWVVIGYTDCGILGKYPRRLSIEGIIGEPNGVFLNRADAEKVFSERERESESVRHHLRPDIQLLERLADFKKE